MPPGCGAAAAHVVSCRIAAPPRVCIVSRERSPRAAPPLLARCSPRRRLHCAAALPGERLNKATREAPSRVWRGYFDRAGESAAQVTYSESWLSSLLSLPHSRVLRAIRHVLLAQSALSAAVVAALRWEVVPPWFFWELPHQLVSVALGLLLVHRMTNANSRFWEGRRAWQRLSDGCRNTSRRALTWCVDHSSGTPESEEAAEARLRVGRDIAAHALALVAATEARLRSKTTLTFHASLSAIVPHTLLEALEAAPHAPLACAHELGRLIAAAAAAGTLSSAHAALLDDGVTEMLAAVGDCDCIARTPTPIEYAAHTSRFLTLFCFSLPFVLAPQMGWLTVPASTLVAYSLLALDEMSAVIEAPFAGYLPLKELFAALRGEVLYFTGTGEAGAAKSSRL